MYFSENNTNVASAFASAWGNIQTPKHNSKVNVKMKSGGSYDFEYTDLTGIFEAIKAMFKEYGLAIMQNGYTKQIEGKNFACVETTLLHSSGEWVKSDTLMFPAATSMQDFGGQITYMKRYSLSAMIGLSTDKDDDSNGTIGNSYSLENISNPKPNYNNQQQSNNMPKTASEAATLIFTFGKHKDKTLKEVFTKDMQYLQWSIDNNKLPTNFVEGFNLMVDAVAAKKAKEVEQNGN